MPQIWSGDASSDSKHDRFSWPKVMRSISLITPEIPNKKIGIDPSVARLLQKVFTTVSLSLSFVFISEREREREGDMRRESESFLLLLPKQHTFFLKLALVRLRSVVDCVPSSRWSGT